jgi:hypothetical protein
VARNLIENTGYVTGKIDEHGYWEEVSLKTKVKNDDKEVRREIVNRFVLRLPMLEEMKRVKRISDRH